MAGLQDNQTLGFLAAFPDVPANLTSDLGETVFLRLTLPLRLRACPGYLELLICIFMDLSYSQACLVFALCLLPHVLV